MQANPISFTEIEAYGRLHGVVFEPWEIDALRSVDDVARFVRAKKGGKNREPDTVVSVGDAEGVKSLMKGLGAKGKIRERT